MGRLLTLGGFSRSCLAAEGLQSKGFFSAFVCVGVTVSFKELFFLSFLLKMKTDIIKSGLCVCVCAMHMCACLRCLSCHSLGTIHLGFYFFVDEKKFF